MGSTRFSAIEPPSRTPLPAEDERPNRGAPASLDDDLPGVADLYAAVSLVASGVASNVVLCGFPAGYNHLRAARALAVEGVVIEPVIRSAGGGFDIQVRRVTPPEA